MEDLLLGLLLVGGLDTAVHQHIAGAGHHTGGTVVAQAQLFPDVHKQLGERRGAVHRCGDAGDGQVPLLLGRPHREAQHHLGLGQIHLLGDGADLLRQLLLHLKHRGDGRSLPSGQRPGESLPEDLPDSSLGPGADHHDLHRRRLQHRLIAACGALRGDGCHIFGVAVLLHRQRLPFKEQLGAAGNSVASLIVHLGCNGVQQRVLLGSHHRRVKASILNGRMADDVRQQPGTGLHQTLAVQRVAVVHMGDGQGDDLVLPRLGDPSGHRGPVELVQLAGKVGKVAAAGIPALHQEGQQRIAGGRLPAQRQDEVDRDAVVLKAPIFYQIDGDPVAQKGTGQLICHSFTLLIRRGRPPAPIAYQIV